MTTVRHDPKAEWSVINVAMMDPRAMDEITIKPEDFWDPKHEALWRIVQEQHRRGLPCDPLSVSQSIPSTGVDGVTVEFINKFIDGTGPARGTAAHHARIVTGLAKLRRIQELGAKLQQTASEAAWDDTDGPLDDARAHLEQIANETAGVQVRTFADILEDAIHEWENPHDAPVYPTGWAELDHHLNGGWKPGQLTILGARPATGKSLVAGCATVAAHEYGAGFFSLEMTERELAARMVATEKSIDLGKIETGDFSEGDWAKIMRLRGEAPNWRVFVEAKPRRSVAQMRATIRTWQAKGPVPLIVVDYAQLVQPANTNDLRERQVSRIAEDLKAVAKDFNCHVLALAQVNRGSTQRDDKRPTMSDLRESGGIEANADNIILLHRDEEQADEIEFIIAKNRHGQTGTLNLVWRPHYASVNSMLQAHNNYRFGM